jgi:hypothetical protein
MGLNPSNAKPGVFPNMAGVEGCDDTLRAELKAAGIVAYQLPLQLPNSEVPTCIIGTLEPMRWGFRRAWYYWIADGPGIPPAYATELHRRHGKDVRVSGHCACPSPLEWHKGFAVGMYHVDTPAGLKALADVIKNVYRQAQWVAPQEEAKR